MSGKLSLWQRLRTQFVGFWRGISANPVAAAAFLLFVVALTLLLAALLGPLSAPSLQAGFANLVILAEVVALLGRWLVDQLIRLGWPHVALICFVLAIVSTRVRRGIGLVWNRAQKVKWGGVEIELSQESAKALATDAEEAFKQYRSQSDRFIRHQLNVLDVRAHLEAAITSDSLKIDNKSIFSLDGFRCTIYIRDILFTDTLYQLLDYYPWDGKPSSGRAFSSRFGIIGRAWRSEQHLGEGEVQTTAETLVENWGMTQEEARRDSRKRPSYVCAILRLPDKDGQPTGVPVGLLFADSEKKDAFGNGVKATEYAEKMARAACERGLSTKLGELRNELNKYSAAIRAHN
jgi:hypothetical protein